MAQLHRLWAGFLELLVAGLGGRTWSFGRAKHQEWVGELSVLWIFVGKWFLFHGVHDLELKIWLVGIHWYFLQLPSPTVGTKACQ